MSSTEKSKLISFEKNKDKKIAQLETKIKHLEMERDILKISTSRQYPQNGSDSTVKGELSLKTTLNIL